MKDFKMPFAGDLSGWKQALKTFKEKLAKRLWSLPTLSEKEKEIAFKECLGDLDEMETLLSQETQKAADVSGSAREESDLLRSLLGLNQDEKKSLLLQREREVQDLTARLEDSEGSLKETSERMNELLSENEELRKTVREIENKAAEVRAEHERIRAAEIKDFGQAHQNLKSQMKDLEFRLGNLKSMFSETNKKMLTEKQDEITMMQKKFLEEMEEALRTRQELMWAEEEMFAKGVAHKVRAALVSAQGQLFFTLERLGLMDPETQTESDWKARIKLFMEGGADLARNFRDVQARLAEVTGALDDFLHLTNRKPLRKTPVSLKDVLNEMAAEFFEERRPTTQLEILTDDPLPTIPADREQILFVLRTLLDNAREALPGESGKIVFSLKNRAKENFLQLLVSDTGSGIPEHFQSRLFEPFFSTKMGHRGLNLSRARRVVELHGGNLDLVKSDTNGTTFDVKFPIMEKDK